MQRFVIAVLVLTGLAGCLGEDTPPQQPTPPETMADPAVFEDGRFAVDVPVPVVLIGFPAGTAAELAEALPELRPDAMTYNNARLLSTNLLSGGASTRANPMDPTAVYSYHELPSAAQTIEARLGELTIAPNLLDANAVEALLAEQIAQAGIPITSSNPGFVLLHVGSNDHAYRIHYPTGYVDGTRAFGENYPFTVLDLSARVDPYVGGARSYNVPVSADDAIEPIVEAVTAHTWYRALQGPIYPQSTKECHAVTLLLVHRATTLSQTLPGYSSADELLDVDYLRTAWESLMGEGRVHVDGRILALPVDDPALEAVLREGQNELLRAYMDLQWDQYHVAHDGCEAYLSVFLIGDVADSGVSGIAMYDVNDDRRISMSWMNDLTAFAEENGAAGPLFYINDASRNKTNWVNFLFSHESGHLFGQRHPHDVSAASAPAAGQTFGAIWSAMSYQQDGKMPLFGALDTNNYWRNRAGFIGEHAAMQGADGTPEFQQALQLMGEYKWQEAGDVLIPLVNS